MNYTDPLNYEYVTIYARVIHKTNLLVLNINKINIEYLSFYLSTLLKVTL